MNSLLYTTPRALIVQYLEDNSHPQLVRWTSNGERFLITSEAMLFEWLRVARPDRYSVQNHALEISSRDDTEEYNCSFLGSAFPMPREIDDPLLPAFRFVTQSKQKRLIANNFVGDKLIQWIIQLLLEQTCVDWIQWTDKNDLKFQLLDLAGLGATYTKVQNIMSKSPEYYIKMLLSSYCLTGILIQIDKKTHHYQFNAKWYAREITRSANGIPIRRTIELCCLSVTHFPEITGGLPF